MAPEERPERPSNWYISFLADGIVDIAGTLVAWDRRDALQRARTCRLGLWLGACAAVGRTGHHRPGLVVKDESAEDRSGSDASFEMTLRSHPCEMILRMMTDMTTAPAPRDHDAIARQILLADPVVRAMAEQRLAVTATLIANRRDNGIAGLTTMLRIDLGQNLPADASAPLLSTSTMAGIAAVFGNRSYSRETDRDFPAKMVIKIGEESATLAAANRALTPTTTQAVAFLKEIGLQKQARKIEADAKRPAARSIPFAPRKA